MQIVRAGIDVGICGEMAGDACYTAILLGLGVDKFSVYVCYCLI